MPRVVIADDHPILVESLRATLTDAGLEVVGTTKHGTEVVQLVESTRPDVLLLDLQMPDMSGLECLAALRRSMPEVQVIILSGADDESSINDALALGAVCYVGKTVDPVDLAATVRIVATKAPIYRGNAASGHPVPAAPPAGETDAAAAVGLTRRELEILRLAAEGMSNGDLARKLWVTEQTVKFHLSNIYRKLEVSNRTQAAAKARTLGLTSEHSGDVPPLAPLRSVRG